MKVLEENRRHRRYPFYATGIICSVGNEEPTHLTTLANNISQSGLGVTAYIPLEEGATVTIELSFTEKGQRTQEKDVESG